MPINPEKYVNVDSDDTPIIRYVKVPVSETRLGVGVADLLGGVTQNGDYMLPRGDNEVDLSTITRNVPSYGLAYKFYSTMVRGDVVLNATSVASSGMRNAFTMSRITSFSAPRLTAVGDSSFVGIFNAASYMNTASFDGLVTATAPSAFNYAFYASSVKTVSFANLETVDGNGIFDDAFASCRLLESVNFDKLKRVNGGTGFYYAFDNCIRLAANPFKNVETIGNSSMRGTFRNCSALTIGRFENLTTVEGSALENVFNSCTGITTGLFDKLATINGNYAFWRAFRNCTSLTEVRFPALVTVNSSNSFEEMLSGCANVTVHFPSNLEETMSSWPDVVAGFGGTNTTILWDLPATA